MTTNPPIVVSLDDYRAHPAPEAVAQLEAYWNRLRGTRLMPTRAEIDPREMADLLQDAFVLERVARGLARFRVAGTRVNGLMGMEVRGMPLTAVILPQSRETVGDALEAVFDEPAAIRMTLSSPAGIARPAIEAQLLLLPLRGEGGAVNRALGCLVAETASGRAPRRFRVTDQTRRALVGYAEDDQGPQRPASSPVAAGRAARSAHLKLVT